jgi:hypothetical protein
MGWMEEADTACAVDGRGTGTLIMIAPIIVMSTLWTNADLSNLIFYLLKIKQTALNRYDQCI